MAGKGMMGMDDAGYWVAHVASVGTFLGTISHFIPAFLALFPAAFYAMQLYQMPVVQRYIRSRRLRRIAKHHTKIFSLEQDMNLSPKAAEEILRLRARIGKLYEEAEIRGLAAEAQDALRVDESNNNN